MDYLTVSALTKYIKQKLETDKHLVSIWLKGEVSNFKRHSRGHLYFTLKDESAQISAIMFSSSAAQLNFSPKEGDHVLVKGKMSVYEAGGSYSIQVFNMTLDGIGELYLKYEALKKDLEEKGYFGIEHKKPIPAFPSKIGVITSSTGAVIEDIRNTVARRYQLAEIHLYPALVQGTGSKESIIKQIRLANALNEVDVLIVGRGGGSIEDLWSFNELEVVMEIFNSKIPIITAIGHETDYTLSDFISDLRAPTPTAAAELATPNSKDLLAKIDDWMDQIEYRVQILFRNIETKLVYLDQRLEGLSPTHQLKNLNKNYQDLANNLKRNFMLVIDHKAALQRELKQKLKSPLDKVSAYQEKNQYLTHALHRQIASILNDKTHSFQVLRQVMQQLNPLTVMDKGFALVKKDDHIITSVSQVQLDDVIKLYLKDGHLTTIIKEKEVK